ncbi:carbohydrate esterase family 3 protein [Lophiostoma macrostomum CBS 122681]|uniref:Carbohydrate esterase family 3 protein n=1 Tax=Lophiostoma macrostomum CBS 122681 TaxID=1314788 RepID=A0A6A6TJP5_9PLEO|nr:carbohydrate esterase family 3 protein [Lophiostoma macrostomum CBS 122681]
MIPAFAVLALFFTLLTLSASFPFTPRDTIPSGEKLLILPLGDSITFGYRPGFNNGTDGYRLELSKRLSGTSFEFIGTVHSGNMSNNANEGHPDFKISQIGAVMEPALDMGPNIVLVHAGTNDINKAQTQEEPYSTAPQRLGTFVDQIIAKVPDAVILVARIIQAENDDTNSRIGPFNDAIPGVMKSRIETGHKIAIVDQSVITEDELADGLHPSEAGYAHMGDIWFNAIQNASVTFKDQSPFLATGPAQSRRHLGPRR